jgi:predicted peptidase
MRPIGLAVVVLAVAACSTATPTQAPTTSPGPPPTSTPQPTATPRPTASPGYRASEHLVLHPYGSDASPLGYIEYTPPIPGDLSLLIRRPLIVFLHGSGESADGDAASLTALYATGLPRVLHTDSWPEDQPFVILMPQFGPDESHCTDPGLIDDFLHFAIDSYPIDPSRVYLTGLSCGAFGAWDYLGLHTDELVAAAVLFAGNGEGAIQDAGCDLGRVPIWAIHGGNDLQVDVSGSEIPIAALNACTDPPPVDARINVYPGVGHVVWQPFYENTKRDVDIYAWMLEYTNPPD